MPPKGWVREPQEFWRGKPHLRYRIRWGNAKSEAKKYMHKDGYRIGSDYSKVFKSRSAAKSFYESRLKQKTIVYASIDVGRMMDKEGKHIEWKRVQPCDLKTVRW